MNTISNINQEYFLQPKYKKKLPYIKTCSVSQIKNLEPPWGNCSSPDLRYYDHYSISSCKMDCENKAVREKCNCRDVHMPPTGNNLCTVDEWVQCVSPLISKKRSTK